MAYLKPEMDVDAAQQLDARPSQEEDVLEYDDVGPADEEDALINTKGASLNYVKHAFRTGGAFCADKDSLKGED
jgi:hypothetical protein